MVHRAIALQTIIQHLMRTRHAQSIVVCSCYQLICTEWHSMDENGEDEDKKKIVFNQTIERTKKKKIKIKMRKLMGKIRKQTDKLKCDTCIRMGIYLYVFL